MRYITVISVLLCLCGAGLTWGQIPKTISYQGRLLQSGVPVPDGSYSVTFRLYQAASGGGAQWSEAQTVTTKQGLFSVVLGAVNPLNVVFDRPYWLAISIAGGTELIPRTPLAASAYSLYANTVIDGSITTAKLLDNAVTVEKVLPTIVSSVDGVTSDGGNIDLIPGTNITITPSDAANTITIAASTVGDITAVNAGTGLSGGGTAGDVNLRLSIPLTVSDTSQSNLLYITNTGTGHAIVGRSSAVGSAGVVGSSAVGAGLLGETYQSGSPAVGGINNGCDNSGYLGIDYAGVWGWSKDSAGVNGFSQNYCGVYGESGGIDAIGVYGEALSGSLAKGVSGYSPSGRGVVGTSGSNEGVWGGSTSGAGVHGYSAAGDGVIGEAIGASKSGVFGLNTNPSGYAGYFTGRVHVNGTLSKAAGSFKIDHPLDPANKYLQHSFVESPDMMNVYNGEVALDAAGTATVSLPAYFESLNKDFRYQLTCIGGYAPVYVAERISGNQFKIAGGTPGLAVSWQVTGVRRDAYANAHRIEVEVDKQGEERSKYLSPTEHGISETLGIDYERIKTVSPTKVHGLEGQE